MSRPVLIVVEGANDGQFLMRLTTQLRKDMPGLPDLFRWQSERRILVVPVGGGDPASWPDRFRAIGLREFHLFDREQLPDSEVRQRAIDRVNAHPDSRGALTKKRSLENYLHSWAIAAAGGGELAFGDDD